jgi:hypothetical protein
LELDASEWLRQYVGDHARGWDPLEHELIAVNAVEDVEVTNAHVLAATCWYSFGEELKGRHTVDVERCREALPCPQKAEAGAVEVDEERCFKEAVELRLA